jgi:CubicO group peptidase (beta-lactamase class C family)
LKHKAPVFFVFTILLGFNSHVFARDLDVAAKAQVLMQEFFDQSQTPGLSVSVGRSDGIAWSAGFGMADLEQAVPVDPSRTLFRIGSVIKPMTAFAIARLVDDGKLDLDAAIQAYLPDIPDHIGRVTTRQLLAHLSGIRHYAGDEFMSSTYYPTVTGGLAIFINDPLVHEPGEAVLYSSYAYNLASAVMESIAGEPYLEHMSREVFTPLEMNHTVADSLRPIIEGRGRYYVRDDGGQVINAPEVDNSYKWASGGVIGTTDDLVRFGLAQLDGQWVSESTQAVFWADQVKNDGESIGRGLGWGLVEVENSGLWIGHTGGSVGGTTSFWIIPEQGIVIAAVSNLSGFDFGTVLLSLSELFTREVTK